MYSATNRWCKKILSSDLECFKNWHFQDIIFPNAQIHCCHIEIVKIPMMMNWKWFNQNLWLTRKCVVWPLLWDMFCGMSAHFTLFPDQAVAPVAGHAPRETGAWCTARGARQRVIRPGTRPTRPASLLMRVCTPDNFTWHSLSSPQSFQHISHLPVEIWELLLITSNDF